jgi:hypothetical protein
VSPVKYELGSYSPEGDFHRLFFRLYFWTTDGDNVDDGAVGCNISERKKNKVHVNLCLKLIITYQAMGECEVSSTSLHLCTG